MNLSKKFKKFLLFWSIFHICAYLTFILAITPSFKTDENSFEYFLFTPQYSEEEAHTTDINGRTETIKNYMFESSSPYIEKENFWPFHNFIFEIYGENVNGFVGIWGFYGHYEFFVYMIIPFLILLLSRIYRRFIS